MLFVNGLLFVVYAPLPQICEVLAVLKENPVLKVLLVFRPILMPEKISETVYSVRTRETS